MRLPRPAADATRQPVEGNPGGAAAGAEANPGAAPSTNKAAAPDAAARPNSKSLAAAQKVIASQAKWSNMLRLKEFRINSVSLQVTSVWLATDLAGTRVDPALPPGQAAPPAAAGETETSAPADPGAPADPAATAPAQSAGAAKYVFVEVRVANAAPVARRYKSWNAAAATAAVLAGDDSQVLAPVPPSATAGVQRLASEQRIPPGQSVFDVLVFEAPPGPFESLKLALAKESLADGAKGHFAIEVPLEALFRKRPPVAESGAAGGAPVAANQGPLAGEGNPTPAIAETTPPAAAPEKPAAASRQAGHQKAAVGRRAQQAVRGTRQAEGRAQTRARQTVEMWDGFAIRPSTRGRIANPSNDARPCDRRRRLSRALHRRAARGPR